MIRREVVGGDEFGCRGGGDVFGDPPAVGFDAVHQPPDLDRAARSGRKLG